MTNNEKTKTELVMDNVHLRRKLDEAEARIERTEKLYRAQLKNSEELELVIRARKEEIKGLKRELPTVRERRVLDMWPRFEGGKPVMNGDCFRDHFVEEQTVESLHFYNGGVCIGTSGGTFDWHDDGERVKRAAPDVLDADDVPIHEGDTVWANGSKYGDGRKWTVYGFNFSSAHTVRACDERGVSRDLKPEWITHREPESWEKLEKDADKGPCSYFEFSGRPCAGCPAEHSEISCQRIKMRDIVRRAKALAKEGKND